MPVRDAILFLRQDPGRNMARFYRVELCPDLMGGVVLIPAPTTITSTCPASASRSARSNAAS